MCQIRRVLTLITMLLISLSVIAQERLFAGEPGDSLAFVDSIPLLNKAPVWAKKYLNSLIQGNVDRTREKAFDVSFGAMPSYTREASFGIGALCTGLYRIDRNDSLPSPSDVVACVNASLNGFFVFFLKGNVLFPDNRSRLNYRVDLYKKRLDFWGINSEQTAMNPKSVYDRRNIGVKINYVYRITHNLYLGAKFQADYTDAKRIANPEYLLGERKNIYVTGIGMSAEIDSRNSIITPTRGIRLAYSAMFYPECFGTAPRFFNSHTFIGNLYAGLWKDALVGFDFYAKLNSSKAPWTMREMVASDGIRMRGYYMGSYIDNSQIAIQAELRQHIWGRLGATAWIGGATVFSSLSDFNREKIRPEWLPNGGLGLRFEFKHNVNARIDFGIGRHTCGFVFAIGEAF
ncbi:MAG: outer membrane protein assembly factor [Paramuribaculum sp.]|nr:outer membrane protein assembly factor [Paramuribaculum sp.]MDE5836259.1 outer membrane protein assembly factor [Paramuribaculum sp.]